MKNAFRPRRSANVWKMPTMNMPGKLVARTLKGCTSGEGAIKGVGIAFIIGIIATVGAASSGMAKPSMPATVLHPSGDPVDVVLDGVGVYSGESMDPSTAVPPGYGFPLMEEETFFSEGGDDWVSRMYVTRDLRAILDALQEGGKILLNPGVYNWNARIVYHKIVGGVEVFHHTSMIQYGGSGRPWASDLDYYLRGAKSGAHGPAVKVVCDIFIHFAADLDRITTPTQIVENIHFDNVEWQDYCYSQGKFNSSNTVLGWRGQADISIKKCKFTGGGVTFHNDGKVTFEGNTMVDTYYGVSVTYPADTDFLVRNNYIRTSSSAGVWCQQNASFLSGTTPKVIEIVGNEIEWAGTAGIGVLFTDASVLIKHNTTTSTPNVYPDLFGHYAGVGSWLCMSDVLIKNNRVVGGDDLMNIYGINLSGVSGATVQSNKVNGTWFYPVVLDALYGPANSNVLVGNNLNNVTTLSGVHYFLSYSDYNQIRGGGVGSDHIVVFYEGDNEGSNLVTGADHRIGQLTQEDPYTSMKEAMSNK